MLPTCVVTQGRPTSIACSSAWGTPSLAYDGSAKMSSACSHGRTSRWLPANRILSPRPVSWTSLCKGSVCGPSPTITNPTVPGRPATASMRKRWPFQLRNVATMPIRVLSRGRCRALRAASLSPGRKRPASTPVGTDSMRPAGKPLRSMSSLRSDSPAVTMRAVARVYNQRLRGLRGTGAEMWRVRTIGYGRPSAASASALSQASVELCVLTTSQGLRLNQPASTFTPARRLLAIGSATASTCQAAASAQMRESGEQSSFTSWPRRARPCDSDSTRISCPPQPRDDSVWRMDRRLTSGLIACCALPSSALPDPLHAVGIKSDIARNHRQALLERLRGQQPIERVGPVRLKFDEARDVTQRDWQLPEAIDDEMAEVKLLEATRDAQLADGELDRNLPGSDMAYEAVVCLTGYGERSAPGQGPPSPDPA